jgi:hypothetical protein
MPWRHSLAGEIEPTCAQRRFFQIDAIFGCRQGRGGADAVVGFMPLLAKGATFNTAPTTSCLNVAEALEVRPLVYALAEPVIIPGSLLEALAASKQLDLLLRCFRPAIRRRTAGNRGRAFPTTLDRVRGRRGQRRTHAKGRDPRRPHAAPAA